MNDKETQTGQTVPLNSLVRLSVVERIEAAERYYRQHDQRFADGLRHAAEIAAPDGWQHIAPAWTKPNRVIYGKENNMDNNIQFARLIAEAEAAGAFTNAVLQDMSDGMDLTEYEIRQIIDRAQVEWERLKLCFCPPNRVIDGKEINGKG